MKALLLFLAIIIFFNSCKKSGSNNSDCQINNYGILKVNFADATVYHSVLFSVGFDVYYKELPLGLTSDTLHVQPGTHTVGFYSYTTPGGPAVNSELSTLNIIVCQETIKSVSF